VDQILCTSINTMHQVYSITTITLETSRLKIKTSHEPLKNPSLTGNVNEFDPLINRRAFC